MKLLSMLVLDKEARLFDAKEFLLKTFLAVLVGSFVGNKVAYLSKDMISLLFGMMLTIEPVNMTGIRSGLKQLEATVIGALITGGLLALLGYSPWTAALTVSATLYVSLLIDWRQFSVVAVFTSIYMNVLVQVNDQGKPSELETFKVRIAALTVGVLIAMIINWVFSVFGYRHMLEKRVLHLLRTLENRMSSVYEMLDLQKLDKAPDIMASFPELFNNVDWIRSTVLDFRKDPLVRRGSVKMVKLEKILKMTAFTREMTHIQYDLCYRVTKGEAHFCDTDFLTSFERTLNGVRLLGEQLENIIHNREVRSEVVMPEHLSDELSMRQMNACITHMSDLLKHYL